STQGTVRPDVLLRGTDVLHGDQGSDIVVGDNAVLLLAAIRPDSTSGTPFWSRDGLAHIALSAASDTITGDDGADSLLGDSAFRVAAEPGGSLTRLVNEGMSFDGETLEALVRADRDGSLLRSGVELTEALDPTANSALWQAQARARSCSRQICCAG